MDSIQNKVVGIIENPQMEDAARKITCFFRKVMAAKSHGKMLTTEKSLIKNALESKKIGKSFDERIKRKYEEINRLNEEINNPGIRRNVDKRKPLYKNSEHSILERLKDIKKERLKYIKEGCFNFKSIDLINDISSKNKEDIINQLGELSNSEEELLNRYCSLRHKYRHQTHKVVPLGKPLLSHERILSRVGSTGNRFTSDDDILILGNNDYVFFALEHDLDNEGPSPLHKKFAGQYYGNHVFIFDEEDKEFDFAYLTLTDHMNNKVISKGKGKEAEWFKSRFPIAYKEIERAMSYDLIFNIRDSKEAIGLNLLKFIRDTKDTKFKEFIFSKKITTSELDKIIYMIFDCEFHVPGMMTTRNAQKITMRKKASDYSDSLYDTIKKHEIRMKSNMFWTVDALTGGRLPKLKAISQIKPRKS